MVHYVKCLPSGRSYNDVHGLESLHVEEHSPASASPAPKKESCETRCYKLHLISPKAPSNGSFFFYFLSFVCYTRKSSFQCEYSSPDLIFWAEKKSIAVSPLNRPSVPRVSKLNFCNLKSHIPIACQIVTKR